MFFSKIFDAYMYENNPLLGPWTLMWTVIIHCFSSNSAEFIVIYCYAHNIFIFLKHNSWNNWIQCFDLQCYYHIFTDWFVSPYTHFCVNCLTRQIKWPTLKLQVISSSLVIEEKLVKLTSNSSKSENWSKYVDFRKVKGGEYVG